MINNKVVKGSINTVLLLTPFSFLFLSAAQIDRGAVVHTIVDVSLQEAGAKTPTGKNARRRILYGVRQKFLG